MQAFEYAIIRVVPDVEREEFVNVGAIVYCGAAGYLDARIECDEARLHALAPALDLELVREHLDAIPRVCRGEADAGPVAAMPLGERFRWLVAPRSTVVQTSRPHAGLCATPEAWLDRLLTRVVRLDGRRAGR